MTVRTKKQAVTELAERLVGECQVSETPKYTGDWKLLYEDLTRQFESAYRVFELEFEHQIDPLIDQVRKARGDLGMAGTGFEKACDRRRKTLESRLERAAMDRRRDALEREDAAKRLKAEQPGLILRVKQLRVALAGGEDVSVPEWPGLASKILFWSTLTVFMAIEYLVGFELFDWISNPNTALGLSAIVVVGFTAGTYFAVHRFRRISGHREAVQRFEQAFPNGHPEGFTVDLLPSAETHVAYTLGALLGVFALVVLAGRIWIASSSELGFGGVGAAIGLLFCFIGYGALEYYLAHPNSRQQVTDLEAAVSALDANRTDLARALESGPAEKRYRDATDQAIAEYNLGIETDHRRYSDTDSIEGQRQEVVDALYGYQLAWEVFQKGLSESCGRLVERVSVRFSLKSKDVVPPGDDIGRSFGRSVQRQYDDPGLLEEFKQKLSPIPLDRPEIDVNKLRGEIELAASTRPEAGDASPLATKPDPAALTRIRAKGASG